MLLKFRDNIWIGDKDAYKKLSDLEEKGIHSVVVVANDFYPNIGQETYVGHTHEKNPSPTMQPHPKVRVFHMGLRMDRNPSYIKDLVCHTPKHMVENGETVLVQGVTGLRRAAYITCRMVCELEGKNIVEVLQELKQQLSELDPMEAYF